jgi:hypothetical protein
MKSMNKTLNSVRSAAGKGLNTTRTTLYELVAAINEQVLPEEDWIVTDVVFELLDTGRVEFIGTN